MFSTNYSSSSCNYSKQFCCQQILGNVIEMTALEETYILLRKTGSEMCFRRKIYRRTQLYNNDVGKEKSAEEGKSIKIEILLCI